MRQAAQADPGHRCHRGCGVAVTALARKLATVIWHRLRNHEPYRSAPVPRTCSKLRSVQPAIPRIPQESSPIHAVSGPCGGTGRARRHPLPATLASFNPGGAQAENPSAWATATGRRHCYLGRGKTWGERDPGGGCAGGEAGRGEEGRLLTAPLAREGLLLPLGLHLYVPGPIAIRHLPDVC